MKPTAHLGDCVEVLATMEPETFDSVVCDPPYELAFMGRKWDSSGVAFRPETWTAISRVMKPGAYLVAFGGTRTSHRMACAIEDAGLEIRDSLLWLYGTGFPKSLDVSKAIDKAAGAEREVVGVKPGHEQFADRKTRGHIDFKGGTDGFDRPWMHDDERRAAYHQLTAPATEAARQWQGWGTALKPAHENIILARKPLAERTVAANVLKHGVGALNVDGCRVPSADIDPTKMQRQQSNRQTWEGGDASGFSASHEQPTYNPSGRFPPNVLHDGSPEVLEAFARFGERTSGRGNKNTKNRENGKTIGNGLGRGNGSGCGGDTGTAARFFPELGFHYSGKATKLDRAGSTHPTIKPQSLMRWLCRLVTPPGGHVLDPFAGSGSTLQAAHREGFRATGIELTPEHFEDIQRRLRLLEAFDDGLFAGMEECA